MNLPATSAFVADIVVPPPTPRSLPPVPASVSEQSSQGVALYLGVALVGAMVLLWRRSRRAVPAKS